MNPHIPNIITLARIALIPVFVVLAQRPDPWIDFYAALVFLVAALTDLLDGYLARKHGLVTPLGKLLDPIADKLLILSGLIMLVERDLAAAWIVIVIVGREMAVTGLRAIAASEGVVMPADRWGKWKTVLQCTAIIMLLLGWQLWVFDVTLIGTGVLWAAMAMAVVSGVRYGSAYLSGSTTRDTGA
ncbi:MAG: CDP-diacylglycerol--glycerol-3-phosphate 3-phosphatidyltransferase [Nitrospirota bacterium]|nr:CDP-diacylglycerol--glycerol-3-phosphate 3-phosphatidyltransferase [Nitrospirota bacterium]